jgi:hypothetical protein
VRIVRVFPRRTALTPTDPMAFVGDPPMFRPDADEVHVSVAFTWDIARGQRLAEAWGQYYPVRIGGPAMGSRANGFEPGLAVEELRPALYVKDSSGNWQPNYQWFFTEAVLKLLKERCSVGASLLGRESDAWWIERWGDRTLGMNIDPIAALAEYVEDREAQ